MNHEDLPSSIMSHNCFLLFTQDGEEIGAKKKNQRRHRWSFFLFAAKSDYEKKKMEQMFKNPIDGLNMQFGCDGKRKGWTSLSLKDWTNTDRFSCRGLQSYWSLHFLSSFLFVQHSFQWAGFCLWFLDEIWVFSFFFFCTFLFVDARCPFHLRKEQLLQ